MSQTSLGLKMTEWEPFSFLDSSLTGCIIFLYMFSGGNKLVIQSKMS
jgi:hypothetical protein